MKRLLYISLFFPLFSYAISSRSSEVQWNNENPIQVRAYDSRKVFGLAEVEVISLVEHIYIENVKLNQGQCKLDNYGQIPPVLLKYNEKVVFEAYACNLKYVEIQTNLGTWINNQFTPKDEFEVDGCWDCEGEDGDEDGIVQQTFENIGGRQVELIQYPPMGVSCPGGYFSFRDSDGNVTDSFGTCSETVDIRKKGDKIIVTMPGYQYTSYGDDEDIHKAAEKVAKQIWQYTYQNGELETKQLR